MFRRPKVICNIGNKLKNFESTYQINNFMYTLLPKDLKEKYYIIIWSSWIAQHYYDNNIASIEPTLIYHKDSYCGSDNFDMLITSWPTPTKFKGFKNFKLGDVILTPNIPHKTYKISKDRRIGRLLLFQKAIF